LAGTSSG